MRFRMQMLQYCISVCVCVIEVSSMEPGIHILYSKTKEDIFSSVSLFKPP